MALCARDLSLLPQVKEAVEQRALSEFDRLTQSSFVFIY